MKKFSTILAVATVALLPTLALAIDIPTQGVPAGIRSFQGFLDVFNTLITWIFTLLLVLAVIFIIFAAFKYLTAGGEDEKIKSAHKMIVYAVVAIAVAFLAQGVSFVVAQLLNSGGAGV